MPNGSIMVLKNMKLEYGFHANFTGSFQYFSVCFIHLGALTMFTLQRNDFLGRWGLDCVIGGLGTGRGARGGMEPPRRRQAGPRGTKNGFVSCPGFWPRGTRKSKNRDLKTVLFFGRVFLIFGFGGVRFWTVGGSDFGASGGPAWGAPAEARRARPEAKFGTFCWRDTNVLAEPARGTFYGHLASHAQGGTPLACLACIFCLCRSYPYNDDYWTDVHHVCIAQRERRATVCYSPGGLEK